MLTAYYISPGNKLDRTPSDLEWIVQYIIARAGGSTPDADSWAVGHDSVQVLALALICCLHDATLHNMLWFDVKSSGTIGK